MNIVTEEWWSIMSCESFTDCLARLICITQCIITPSVCTCEIENERGFSRIRESAQGSYKKIAVCQFSLVVHLHC